MANIYTSRNSATNPSSDNSAYTLNGFEFQNPYGSTSLSGTGLFGAVTSKDKARYEQSQAEKEWLSQMQLYEYEQWYNSEEQQVARMRAAGLNPDLLGLESASETSAPDSMISGMAAPSGAQDVDTVMSFITSIASLASGVSAMRLNASQRVNLAATNENLKTQGTINELSAAAALGGLFGDFATQGLPVPTAGFSSNTMGLIDSYAPLFAKSRANTIGTRKAATSSNNAYAEMWKSAFGGGGVGNADLAFDGIAKADEAGYDTQQTLFKLGEDCIKAAHKELQRSMSSADRSIAGDISARTMNYDARTMFANLSTDEQRSVVDSMNGAMARVIKNYIDVHGKSKDPYQRYIVGQLSASYFKMVNPFTYNKFNGGIRKNYIDAEIGTSSPWFRAGESAAKLVADFF